MTTTPPEPPDEGGGQFIERVTPPGGTPVGTPGGPPPPSEPKPARPWWKKKRFIFPIGLVLVFILIGSLSDGGDTVNQTAGDATPTASAAEETTPQETVTEEPVEETPEPVVTEPPLAKPKVYSGVGSKLLKVRKSDEPEIVTITGTGSSGNFAVWSKASGGEDIELLVNTIGRYKGTHLINALEGEEVRAFKIEGTGFRWRIVVKPLLSARTWDGGTLRGSGDDVIVTDPDMWGGLDSAKITHRRGSSNFAVYAYADSQELLVNEIGRFTGEVQIPEETFVLVFQADGEWTARKV